MCMRNAQHDDIVTFTFLQIKCIQRLFKYIGTNVFTQVC